MRGSRELQLKQPRDWQSPRTQPRVGSGKTHCASSRAKPRSKNLAISVEPVIALGVDMPKRLALGEAIPSACWVLDLGVGIDAESLENRGGKISWSDAVEIGI